MKCSLEGEEFVLFVLRFVVKGKKEEPRSHSSLGKRMNRDRAGRGTQKVA